MRSKHAMHVECMSLSGVKEDEEIAGISNQYSILHYLVRVHV